MADDWGSWSGGNTPTPSAGYSSYDPSVYSYGGGSSSVPDFSSYWNTPPSSLNTPVYAPSQAPPPTLDYSTASTGVAGDPTAQYYNYFQSSNPGPTQAFQAANALRWNQPWAPVVSQNPYLANAEHALFTNMLAQGMPGGLGYIGSAIVPPVYQAAKIAAQTFPNTAGAALAKVMPTNMDLRGATPASWEQLLWGLKPFWPTFNQYLR